MLRSTTQLAESHGDELGLEHIWNGDELFGEQFQGNRAKCRI